MTRTPSVAVVMVNYRTPDLALEAVAALAAERADVPGLRLVLVDGGSGDGSAERLAEEVSAKGWGDWVELLPLVLNGGFGWANNQAMQALLQGEAAPDYIHLLNPDTEVAPGAVRALVRVLEDHADCGAVGSLLLEADGSPSGSAFSFPSVATEFRRGLRMEKLADRLGIASAVRLDAAAGPVDWVTGASVMFRSEALKRVGLFDTGFFLYFEEVELMRRLARGGWTVRHEPESRVGHIGGASTGVNRPEESATRPPMPLYWYHSRRRFLALRLGRRGALAASLAWLAGHGLFLVRRAIGSGRGHARVAREARGMLAHGLMAEVDDLRSEVCHWGDPVGVAPAWMKNNAVIIRG